MPDASSSVTVDGVKPSILIKFVGNPDDPTNSLVLNPTDDGAPRTMAKNGPAVYVTPDELAQVTGYSIVVVDEDDPEHEKADEVPTVSSSSAHSSFITTPSPAVAPIGNTDPSTSPAPSGS